MRQSLAIVPRHPFRGASGQFPGMALQLDQVGEGVGSTQLAGVDQAHEQVADLSPAQGAVEEGFFRCKTARFNALSAMLLSNGWIRGFNGSYPRVRTSAALRNRLVSCAQWAAASRLTHWLSFPGEPPNAERYWKPDHDHMHDEPLN